MQPTKQNLSEQQLRGLLTELPEWALQDGKLVRDWTLPTFVEAIAFVNRVARIAQEAQHRPDIAIRRQRAIARCRPLALAVRLAVVSRRRDRRWWKHPGRRCGRNKRFWRAGDGRPRPRSASP